MKGRRSFRAEWRVNSERSEGLPQAEFISAEDAQSAGPPRSLLRGGGPAKESVEKQIELIEEFVEARA